MKAQHMDPQPSALASFVSEFGSLLVAGVLAFVGWVMKAFTTQHIQSMREMTAEVAKINVKVASMDTNISAMAQRQDDLASRVNRLEDHERTQ